LGALTVMEGAATAAVDGFSTCVPARARSDVKRALFFVLLSSNEEKMGQAALWYAGAVQESLASQPSRRETLYVRPFLVPRVAVPWMRPPRRSRTLSLVVLVSTWGLLVPNVLFISSFPPRRPTSSWRRWLPTTVMIKRRTRPGPSCLKERTRTSAPHTRQAWLSACATAAL